MIILIVLMCMSVTKIIVNLFLKMQCIATKD